MQIGVSGNFEFFKVFNKKLQTSVVCKLAISNSHSLIYAEMKDLDVVALLNEAFDLGLKGASLNVTSAGFFTFSANRGSTPQATLQGIFPGSPVPASVAAVATPVTDTTSFWLTVALTGPEANDGLFFSIVDIGISNNSTISLSATFAKDKLAADAIRHALYTIALDGSVRLFDVFTLRDVVINYSIGEAKKLSVSGTLDVSLFDSDFTFTGSIQSDSARKVVTANIAAAGNAKLSSLFGDDFPGISFSNIAFHLYYPYGSEKTAAKFMVRGDCDFAGLQFTGLLYMEGTKPALASVVFTRSASISTLFDQCITGASWPSELIDLTLLAGCQVYYNGTGKPLTLTLSNDGTAPTLLPVPAGTGTVPAVVDQGTASQGTAGEAPRGPKTVTYAPGFNLAASFVLKLLNDINVAGTVVVNNRGVTASIDITDPIDIYVLSITRQGNPDAGPVLSFQTQASSGSMSFAGSLLFFQESFGVDVTVTATRNARRNLRITTTLAPTRDYAPLLSKTDRLTFSYSADEGFRIRDWPAVTALEEIINFFDTLKRISGTKGSGCGALVDFIFTELLEQNWDLTLAFNSETENGTKGLNLTLAIAYGLKFSGDSFATITLPNAMVIPIPRSVSLDSDNQNYLWKVIVNALKDAAESLVQALLDNPEAIAQFLVLFAGKQAAQYAATLICQGLVDAAVDAAVAAAAEAAGEALGTAAAAGAVAAIGTAAAAAIAQAAGGDSGADNAPPSAPGNLVATISGGTVTASWWLSRGAQSYAAAISDQTGKRLAESGTLDHQTRSHFFDVRPETLPATCTIAVTAANPHGTGPAATATVTYLAAPTGLAGRPAAATAPDAAMEIDWLPAADATSYAVTATGPATLSWSGTATSAVLTFGPGDPAGRYAVTVIATGGDRTIPSPASAAFTLVRLAAPDGLTASATADALIVRWNSVADAASYVLAWTAPDGTTGTETVAAVTGDTQTGSVAPAAAADGTWTVTIQAFPADGPGQAVGGPPSAPATAEAAEAVAPRTPVELARHCCRRAVAGPDCGRRMVAAFPELHYYTLLVAMLQGGYALDVGVVGMRAAYPTVTDARLSLAFGKAYPTPQNAAELAKGCHDLELKGEECGRQLLLMEPDLDVPGLATAMAKGGYPAEHTGKGLKAAFPAIVDVEMALAIAQAYPS